MIRDTFERPLRNLRLSVTDRCNLRCSYCMPAEVFGKDYAFLPRHDILTFEEIARVVRVAAGHGVTKVRPPSVSGAGAHARTTAMSTIIGIRSAAEYFATHARPNTSALRIHQRGRG